MRIDPITEVGSGRSTSHASLDNLVRKYRERCGERFVIHGKGLKVDGDTTYIPIHMTIFL